MAQQSNRAVSSISTAFNVTPPGCETAHVPWAGQAADEFDRAYYEAWLSEIRAEPRLQGFHTSGYYSAMTTESDGARDELASVLLNHFGKPLQSMGFEIANNSGIEQVTHGHRKLVTLIQSETELEVDMRFVFGRDGFTFVAINLGVE